MRVDYVYELSRRGRIPTITFGRTRRYRREAIEQWLDRAASPWHYRERSDKKRPGGAVNAPGPAPEVVDSHAAGSIPPSPYGTGSIVDEARLVVRPVAPHPGAQTTSSASSARSAAPGRRATASPASKPRRACGGSSSRVRYAAPERALELRKRRRALRRPPGARDCAASRRPLHGLPHHDARDLAATSAARRSIGSRPTTSPATWPPRPRRPRRQDDRQSLDLRARRLRALPSSADGLRSTRSRRSTGRARRAAIPTFAFSISTKLRRCSAPWPTTRSARSSACSTSPPP